MRNLVLCFCILCITSSAFAQKESTSQPAIDSVPSADIVSDPLVFTKAETDPKFPGSTKDWSKFMQKNLRPEVPVNNGLKRGQFTIVVQFIVEKDGSLTDIKPLTNHGYGMEEECVRLMQISPKWQPATQNGQVVRCYRKQQITFVIAER